MNAFDQAAGLRHMTGSRGRVRVIAVTSGKGGVGKTNVSVNTAVALAQQGQRVMLMDADLGLANVDVLLGLHVEQNLSHVLDGVCGLEEVLLPGPGGIRIIPAASGVKRMASLGVGEHAGIIHAFSTLSVPPDVLLVDTAAGITDSVIRFTAAAQEVLVVVCDEPASITDAYALIKVLNREQGVDRFHILANMAGSAQEGYALFQKLVRVSDRFLNVSLDFVGSVPFDESLRRAVQRQSAVVESHPRSRAALAFRKVAQSIQRWPGPTAARGHLEFFVERLLHGAPHEQAEVLP
jgi:flagellar biosynthesis protein FlhG